MGSSEITAKSEYLHKITLEEKAGIDDYIENVKSAVGIITMQVNSMSADGDTINDIKDVLREDLNQLNVDLRKLESVSEQLQTKANKYEAYLNLLRRAKK